MEFAKLFCVWLGLASTRTFCWKAREVALFKCTEQFAEVVLGIFPDSALMKQQFKRFGPPTAYGPSHTSLVCPHLVAQDGIVAEQPDDQRALWQRLTDALCRDIGRSSMRLRFRLILWSRLRRWLAGGAHGHLRAFPQRCPVTDLRE